jgi:hypothetical protein
MLATRISDPKILLPGERKNQPIHRADVEVSPEGPPSPSTWSLESTASKHGLFETPKQRSALGIHLGPENSRRTLLIHDPEESIELHSDRIAECSPRRPTLPRERLLPVWALSLPLGLKLSSFWLGSRAVD